MPSNATKYVLYFIYVSMLVKQVNNDDIYSYKPTVDDHFDWSM